MVTVRLWKQTDIDYVEESVEQARWGYARRDVERCWQFEPNGCFLAQINNKPVGHVFSINYGKMGWIGLLIVKEEHRNRGIGTLLTQEAIEHLRKVGVETIRLEAAERAVPLYKRLGFIEEFDSLRFIKPPKQVESKRLSGQRIRLDRIKEKDLKTTAKFDSTYFGANRLQVLRSLYQDSPQNCFVAKEKQETTGYIMSRPIPNAYRIGPWVCAKQNSKVAGDLLLACTNSILEKETELRIGMPAPNTNGIELMKKLGFQLVGKSIRMVWGKHKHKGDVLGIYGIAGPEKG
jgi:predicted N-acetyltransferase YhbS